MNGRVWSSNLFVPKKSARQSLSTSTLLKSDMKTAGIKSLKKKVNTNVNKEKNCTWKTKHLNYFIY